MRATLVARAAVLDAGEPLSPRRWLEHHLVLPWVAVGLRNLRALHAALGFRWEAPLLDLQFLGALVGSTRWWEYRGRAELLRRHFADLVAPEVAERTSKASFTSVLFGASTRAFATAWDGTGVPDGVRPDRLRAEWLTQAPHIGTAVLLHIAWLASAGVRRDEPPL